jgi:hypothetical protein
MDYLKIDIDSYDCDVLEAILKAGYRPKVHLVREKEIVLHIVIVHVDREHTILISPSSLFKH